MNRATRATPALRAGRGHVLIGVMLTMGLAAMDATIVATAVPSIVRDLGDFALFTWIFSIYVLAQAVTIPVYGKLADLHGRKPVLIARTVIFYIRSMTAAVMPACRSIWPRRRSPSAGPSGTRSHGSASFLQPSSCSTRPATTKRQRSCVGCCTRRIGLQAVATCVRRFSLPNTPPFVRHARSNNADAKPEVVNVSITGVPHR